LEIPQMLKNTEVEVTNKIVKTNVFPCPPDSYDEDIHTMPLDFDSIREETQKAKKAKVSTKIEKDTHHYILSEKEKKQITGYVKDMEKHIDKWSREGKDKFTYDCSKLSIPIFLELVLQFKETNPKFYVEKHNGPRLIIVDWVGKNEV